MSDRLDQIRARWAAATPGPWRQDHNPEKLRDAGGDTFARVISGCSDHGVISWTEQNQCDMDAIAHAPEDVAWLVAEVERAAHICALLAEPSDVKVDRLCDVYDAAQAASSATWGETSLLSRWAAVRAILADLRERAGGGE